MPPAAGRFRSALVLLLATAAAAAGGETRPATSPILALCSRPGLPVGSRCGRIEVPEDRRRPSGRRIGLDLAVLPATGSDPRPDPLVILEGGPGASVLRFAGMHALTFASARQSRDLVLLDQRGTGGSAPMTCESVRPGPGGLWPVAEVRACVASLAGTSDPRAYLTSAAVADLEEVRQRLGYERLNLFGVSYGTRTALDYLRRHPDRVRSAILLAAYPPGRNVPLEAAAIAQRALAGLFEDCRNEAACREAFPDPAADLAAALARFGDDGVVAWEADRITLDLFASTMRLLLFFPSTASRIPSILHRAAAGDFGPYSAAAGAISGATGGWISTGTFLSILCNEDVARLEREEVERRAAGTLLGAAWTASLIDACAVWPRTRAPADFHRPLATSAPMLLLVGELDPAMPAAWSVELAETLPAARAVVIPEGHHSLIGMSGVDCVLGLMDRFLDTASATELDTSCVAAIERPPFVTR